MIYLLLIFTIEAAIEAYHSRDYEKAYKIAVSLSYESEFERYEIIELQAYISTSLREFDRADSLFQIAMQAPYDSILSKAYTNYADLQYRQFNFDERLRYLRKAVRIERTPQRVRVIARHYIQLEADFVQAQHWIDLHRPQTDRDRAGFKLLLAEFHEAQRQYELSGYYYHAAKEISHKAGMFDYELFSAMGLHRSKVLAQVQRQEKFADRVEFVIFVIIMLTYAIIKFSRYGRTSDVSG